ncbi:methyltransferase [Jatrophihabitans endophyticus]|uniref:DUF7782 domain-containing protein n=1 Tax=Jatrophihabitans endophyticus TaxID=1206085 RepID=UPI001A0ED98A|nr:methyltransferase [Jatrophihabitans endophyticus]MBE7186865.1 methyltransferase [Jatrophihabitans endophyticus]
MPLADDTPGGNGPDALLEATDLDRFRQALNDFTVDGVADRLGLRGRAALERGDVTGAARELRAAADDPVADLTSLFLLGEDVDVSRAARALAPLPLGTAVEGGLLAGTPDGGSVRAAVEVRPYAEAVEGATDWWVVSDLGSDVRPGPLAADHVLGIGSASLTLAQATPRLPVGRALDVGTGCGVQALHLDRHAHSVTATDLSPRALRFAATTAALSGRSWDLRRGSLLEPVAGERFDLVVANPPFVVSGGGAGFDYRDSGLAGDAVCETLLRGLPDVLADDGCAVLLANWVVRDGEDWSDRLGSWVAGHGCDVWAWQREVAGPDEYVSLWLRDAGYRPGTADWTGRYDAWCAWFESSGVAAVGMGLVALWRTGQHPVLAFDDVRQAIEQPVGGEVHDWAVRARWLRDTDDDRLLAAVLTPAPDLVRSRGDLLGDGGWRTAAQQLRQSHGLRWEIEVDDAVAALVAGCAAGAPLATCIDLLSLTLDATPAEIATAVLPTVRDLVARGFLLPPGSSGPVT